MGSEDLVRVASYVSVLGVMAIWEVLAPRRTLTASKLCRWGGNLTRIAVSHVEPIGAFHAWRPLMPVTQLAVVKP